MPLDADGLTIRLGGGRRATFYEPVGPARCDACGRRADDLCVEIVSDDRPTIHFGMCSECLIDAISARCGHNVDEVAQS
jgi:hypothetical protein